MDADELEVIQRRLQNKKMGSAVTRLGIFNATINLVFLILVAVILGQNNDMRNQLRDIKGMISEKEDTVVEESNIAEEIESTDFVESNCTSNSEWGADDELGMANLITSDSILAAVSLVSEGKSHGLGVAIDPGVTPAFSPRTSELTIVAVGQEYGKSLEPA